MTYEPRSSLKNQVLSQATPLFMVAMLAGTSALGINVQSFGLQKVNVLNHSQNHAGLRYTRKSPPTAMLGRGQMLTAPFMVDQPRSARSHNPRFKDSRKVLDVVARAAKHSANDSIFESEFHEAIEDVRAALDGKASWFFMDVYSQNNQFIKESFSNSGTFNTLDFSFNFTQPADIIALHAKAYGLPEPPQQFNFALTDLENRLKLFIEGDITKETFDAALTHMKDLGYERKKNFFDFTRKQKEGAYAQTLRLLGLAHSLGNLTDAEDAFMRQVVGKIYYIFDLRGPGGFAEDKTKSSRSSPADKKKV